MAVTITSFNELPQGESRGEPGSESNTRIFRAIVTRDPANETVDLAPVLVKNYIDAPKVGDAHPTISGLTVHDVNAAYEGDERTSLLLTVLYQTGSPPNFGTNPWDQPIEVGGSFVVTTAQVSLSYDETDELTVPVVNSSNVQFDPPPVADIYDPAITLIKRYAPGEFNLQTYVSMRGAINSVDWTVPEVEPPTVISAGKGRIAGSSWSLQYHNSQKYVEAHYEIIVREEGWIDQYLDAGHLKKSGTAVPPCFETILDASGNAASEPVLLNGAGEELNCNEDPVYLLHRHYRRKRFQDLGI